MLKFGGSRPESDGTEAKDRDRKQRHQRSAVPVGASPAAGGGAGAAGGAPIPMDTSRGDATPKVGGAIQQMAPPEVPFGASQPQGVSRSRLQSRQMCE